MLHSLPLVTTIATALGMALVLGFLAIRLKIPAIVGYLLAGVMIGPFTPGIEVDTELASELAEIGVMLLMFGVGLHFSIDDLLKVRKISVPGATLQMVIATALGLASPPAGAGISVLRWCSAWRCRSPVPSFCCARWRRAGRSNR